MVRANPLNTLESIAEEKAQVSSSTAGIVQGALHTTSQQPQSSSVTADRTPPPTVIFSDATCAAPSSGISKRLTKKY